MKNLALKDVDILKKLNKEVFFSLYDYIYYVFHSKQLKTDFYFALLELFWPSFVVYDNYVFLKENFIQDKIKELIKYNDKIEFWTNLVLINPYFYNDDEEQKKAEVFAKILIEIWHSKLNKDFPNLKFTVEYIYDSENGDCGLTFYQTN